MGAEQLLPSPAAARLLLAGRAARLAVRPPRRPLGSHGATWKGSRPALGPGEGRLRPHTLRPPVAPRRASADVGGLSHFPELCGAPSCRVVSLDLCLPEVERQRPFGLCIVLFAVALAVALLCLPVKTRRCPVWEQ